MRRTSIIFSAIYSFAVLLLLLNFIIPGHAMGAEVVFTRVDGPIDPVISRHIRSTIKECERREGVVLLVIEMNTPGGLLDSTEEIVRSISNSRVPVCVYISPRSARAASAGVYISLASDVIAMAPQTLIGAAHPVNLGSSPEKTGNGRWKDISDSVPVSKTSSEAMLEKVTNYLVTKAKSLARAHDRNVEWAEKVVRDSVMIEAEEALESGVIEVIAKDRKELLQKLNERELAVKTWASPLDLAGTSVREVKMSVFAYIIHKLINPQVAYFLLTLGFMGLFFEFQSPGIGFPGVVGAICLILAFLGMHMLPINLAGIMLIILGIILLVLEVYVPSFGILTVGGISAFTFGSLILIDAGSEAEYYSIPTGLVLATTTVLVVFVLIVGFLTVRGMRRKVETGKEGLEGQTAVVKNDLDPEGYVLVEGELWRAETPTGAKVEKGENVKVVRIERGKLLVEPADDRSAE